MGRRSVLIRSCLYVLRRINVWCVVDKSKRKLLFVIDYFIYFMYVLSTLYVFQAVKFKSVRIAFPLIKYLFKRLATLQRQQSAHNEITTFVFDFHDLHHCQQSLPLQNRLTKASSTIVWILLPLHLVLNLKFSSLSFVHKAVFAIFLLTHKSFKT